MSIAFSCSFILSVRLMLPFFNDQLRVDVNYISIASTCSFIYFRRHRRWTKLEVLSIEFSNLLHISRAKFCNSVSTIYDFGKTFEDSLQLEIPLVEGFLYSHYQSEINVDEIGSCKNRIFKARNASWNEILQLLNLVSTNSSAFSNAKSTSTLSNSSFILAR